MRLKLKLKRISKSIPTNIMARKVGIGSSSYSLFEHGRINLTADHREKIREILEDESEDLFENEI